jgi:hypothetical protein
MKRSIMTILITILSILTWFNPTIASAASPATTADNTGQEAISADQTAQPEIVIPDPLFTFENVVDGTEVVHDFPVYNRGTGDLEIAKIQTG